MSMFNDIACGSRDNEVECLAHAKVVSLYARKCGTGRWSFFGLGSEKKWSSISEDSPQGERDKMAEKMMLTFEESGHPIFRATSPLSRGRVNDTLLCRFGNDLNCFSHNHFCISAQSLRSSRGNV